MTTQEIKDKLNEFNNNADDAESERLSEFLAGYSAEDKKKEKFGDLEIEFIRNSDNLNDGAEVEIVLKIGEQHFKGSYYYTSWGSNEYMDIIDSLTEVTPKQKVVTVYE